MPQVQHAVNMRKNSAWIRAAYAMEFESSPGKTSQFTSFANTAKAWWKAFVELHGYRDLDFHVGHFEISGFFTDSTGQAWYFNSGDVRYKISKSLLIRTARDYRDFSGGQNRSVSYDDQDQFAEKLVQLIYRQHPDL